MKTILTLTITIILLLAAGCGNQYAATTVGNDEVLITRLGIQADENINTGLLMHFTPGDDDIAAIGVYGTYSLDEIEVDNPIDWLPATLTAKPYIGAQAGFNNLDDKDSFANLIAGLEIQDLIVLDYQDRNDVWAVGVKMRF